MSGALQSKDACATEKLPVKVACRDQTYACSKSQGLAKQHTIADIIKLLLSVVKLIGMVSCPPHESYLQLDS